MPVELSKTEQRLLRLLVEHRGQTLSRELLLDRVWDGGEFVDENALSVAVNRLRAKLADAPIRTVYGLGYQLGGATEMDWAADPLHGAGGGLGLALWSVPVAAAPRRQSGTAWTGCSTGAMDGSFLESCFDESVPSALEARMARFLNGSASSARNLAEEKSKIAALIADVSHQTKTPIANLLLYASLLAESELTPEQREQAEAI